VDRARLATNPFFAGLPDDELEVVARVASDVQVADGEALTTEGDFGHALFIVESGTAEVTRDGATVGEVGPGDVVGEIAVLASGRRTASVIATSPLTLISLFKRDVWALERDAPEAARRVRSAFDARAASHSNEGTPLGTSPS
jgi:CPA1 family monovalent cation:H+ antiporter